MSRFHSNPSNIFEYPDDSILRENEFQMLQKSKHLNQIHTNANIFKFYK